MIRECIAAGVACIVIVTILRKTLSWVWFKPKGLEKRLKEQGLKGNSYRLLIGDLKETSRLRKEARDKPLPFTHDYFPRILPFLHQVINKYGQNCFTWVGPIPVVNISDPKLIKDALSRMNEFRRPDLNPLIRLIATGLLSAEGEKWARHRKLLNPAFHAEKLKLMFPAFCTSIMEFVEAWKKTLHGKGPSEIDVWEEFNRLSAEVLSRAAFSSSYEEGRMIFERLKEQTELTLCLLQTAYIPGFKYLPTKNNRRMKVISHEVQSTLEVIINKRKKEMENGEPVKNDLLGLLLEQNFKETQKEASHAMGLQDIVDECKLFYLAGSESTATLLSWTMVMLGKYQDWQTKAREEVLATFGKNQPDFDGLSRLKTLTMIVHEVLRLYPPAVTLSRMVYDKDTKLGDLSIPPGVMIGCSVLQVHHDPKVWGDDAKEFNPNRFSEGILKASKGNMSFFPFGWGPRVCMGQNFAIIEAKMALAMLLQRFSFELSPSYTHAPTSILGLQPQHGAYILMQKL